MAASAAMAMASTWVVPSANSAGLSSSAAFGSSFVRVSPLRPVAVNRNAVVARASLPEERTGRAARREMLAGLMAASAALVTAGSAVAGSGPGTPGAERTNEKAGELLKAADDLTNVDSPPRYGPDRGVDADPGQIAQQGGSGAIEEIQGATGSDYAIESAKRAVEAAKANLGDLVKW